MRARRLVLNGPVGGDVQACVEELELGSRARVGGGLSYTASTFTQDPAAVVTVPLQRVEWQNMHEVQRPAMSGWCLPMPLSMGFLGALALAGATLFEFSRFAVQAAHHIETEPWRTLGLGAVLLLGCALAVNACLVGRRQRIGGSFRLDGRGRDRPAGGERSARGGAPADRRHHGLRPGCLRAGVAPIGQPIRRRSLSRNHSAPLVYTLEALGSSLNATAQAHADGLTCKKISRLEVFRTVGVVKNSVPIEWPQWMQIAWDQE
jgi:hypothetical protein